jgi:hypothetical protein
LTAQRFPQALRMSQDVVQVGSQGIDGCHG